MGRLKWIVLVLLLASAPVSSAQSVRVNWQQSAPFASYRTFAWRDPANPAVPFYGQWVQADVIAQLTSKGLQPVASGQMPDIIATYNIHGQEVMDAQTTSEGFDTGIGPWGGGWGWWGGWGGWDTFPDDGVSYTSERPRQILFLSVNLLDAKNKKLVWSGQATVENVSTSQKGDEDQTRKCVEKMFKRYPPK
jgi:hypothetical protein